MEASISPRRIGCFQVPNSFVRNGGSRLDPFAASLTDFTPFREEDKKTLLPGLYAFFGESGDVLYVGESSDVPRRITEHRRKKKWWPEVREIRVLRWENPSDRLIVETVVQLREFPKYCRAIKLGLSPNSKTVHSLQFIRSRPQKQE